MMKSKSFKKAIVSVLALLMIVASLPLSAVSADELIYNDLLYTVNNGEVEITGYMGYSSELVIPDTIDGYPVTVIGWYAFNECDTLESVTIPDSVTVLFDSAFDYCYNLKTVVIPEGVKKIGAFAFADCYALESVTIPDSVTYIGNFAFQNCKEITSISIPSGVSRISDGVFYGCEKLAEISLPDGIKTIGSLVFDETAFYNEESNWTNNTLYIGNYLIAVDTSVSGDYDIDMDTTAIAAEAFEYCDKLTSVIVPEGITNIGDRTFGGCTSLTSIILPDSLESVGSEAFYGTSFYEDDSNWENGVLYLGDVLIAADEDKLSGDYEVKAGTRIIADSAFDSCKELTSISFPDSVESIGENVFYFCEKLTFVKMSEGIKRVGKYAFYGTAFYDEDANWENGEGYGALYVGNVLLQHNSFIDEIYYVKEGTKVIAADSFNYYSFAVAVSIPESVTSIDDDAFINSQYVTLYGYTGSYVESYAQEHGIRFVAIDDFTDNTEPTATEELTTEPSSTATEPSETSSAVESSTPEPSETAPFEATTSAAEPSETAPFESTPSDNTELGSEYDLGDVNKDSKLNIRDATLIQKYLAKLAELDEEAISLADFDQNGKVNVKDATAIQKFIAGIK